jgi:hypothetical protein
MTDRSPADWTPRPAIVQPLGDPGEERLARAARAAHVLCETLWETLHEQLDVPVGKDRANHAGVPAAERVAELAGRLVDVTATVVLLARAHRPATAAPTPALAPIAPPPPPAGSSVGRAQPTARLIDERDEQTPRPGESSSAAAPPRSRAARASPRPRPWDASGAAPSQARETPKELLLDNHRREEPASWADMIASALEQFERDRLPFVVLLVEILDVEPLRAPPGQPQDLTPQIENAFARALQSIGGRNAASLMPERPDRYWLLVPDVDRAGALELTDRLVSSFESVGASSGTDPAARYFAALSAPLRASQDEPRLKLAIGAAICPENGDDAAELMAHAEAELAAGRAAERHTVAAAEPV